MGKASGFPILWEQTSPAPFCICAILVGHTSPPEIEGQPGSGARVVRPLTRCEPRAVVELPGRRSSLSFAVADRECWAELHVARCVFEMTH